MTEEFDFSRSDAVDEAAVQPPQLAPVMPTDRSAASAGAALRQAREAKGVHIVTLASSLKVPTHYLEHLESGQFEALPDLVFAKALASSVCRHIGVDTAEVMQWWPVVDNPTLAKATPVGPIKPTVFDPYPDRPRPWRRLLLAAGFIVLLAGLIWVWLAPSSAPGAPADALSDAAPVALESTASTVIQAQTTAPTVAPGLDSVAESRPERPGVDAAMQQPVAKAEAEASTNGTAAGATAPITGIGSEPSASPSTVDGPANSAAPSPAVMPGGAPEPVLAMQFNKNSWLELRNGQGKVLVARVIQAGQQLQWPLSEGPWSVVLGNVRGVEVRVDGQPRDVMQDTQRGVARFVVEKP